MNPDGWEWDGAAEAARILREEIDKDILNKICGDRLRQRGWTIVSIPYDQVVYPHIKSWLRENTKNSWIGLHDSWYFESEDDATLFKMRWL